MLVEVMYCLFELCNLCLYDLKTSMFAINLHVLKFTSCSNLVNCQFFNAFMSVCVCVHVYFNVWSNSGIGER